MKKGILLLTSLLLVTTTAAQEAAKDTVPDKAERPAFESSYIIDTPTDLLYQKNSLEFMINHRMDMVNDGNLIGLFGSANIRLGLTYTLHERLQVGFGTEKNNKYQDFNWRIALFRQTRSGSMPVNISYYGNFVIDARGRENFILDQHRYSYFNQLVISRRFSRLLSLQIAPSISHYNVVPEGMRNDVVGVAIGGRYKVSSQTSVLLDYSQPLANNWDSSFDPEPGFSLGVEFATSGHAFQVFISNLKGIIPQDNYMFNEDPFKPFDGEFLIGFNITRKYNF